MTTSSWKTIRQALSFAGTETSLSVRAGLPCQMRSAISDKGQLYVRWNNIALYAGALGDWHAPLRDRKLLLQKRELRHLNQKVKEKGLTIVAVRLFISENGYAKLNIALARGKKQYDKRESIKEKDLRRAMERGE